MVSRAVINSAADPSKKRPAPAWKSVSPTKTADGPDSETIMKHP